MKNILIWIVVNTCRLLVSTTFIFSGLVKLIDPTGTAYKIEDYAAALGATVLLAEPLPLVAAVLLALTEFCLGVYLFFGIRRRLTTRAIVAVLLVFTPLTLWLAVTDAVADCGCFGDALKLSNWQTFAKDAVLLAMAILLCWTRRQQTRLISVSAQWLISLFSIVFGTLLALTCLAVEPVIDFRPFYVGQDIAKAMEWPEDPEQQPEILDFTIDQIPELPTAEPVDIDYLLADTGYVFMLIAPHIDRASDSEMDVINSLSDFASANGYRFLCLTASSLPQIRRWQALTGADYEFAFADELTLKTIVRSNPGLVILHHGVIVDKSSDWMMSYVLEKTAHFRQNYAVTPKPTPHSETFLRLLMAYVLPQALFTIIDRLVAALKWWWRRRRSRRITEQHLAS